MEKKVYMSPLTELATINLSGVILTSPPSSGDITPPPPSHPGAPKRRVAPVF